MWSVASLQLPNVFGKFGLVLIFGALDGFCVVSESCLEFVGCNPNVCFRFVIVSCCYFGFVYHTRPRSELFSKCRHVTKHHL